MKSFAYIRIKENIIESHDSLLGFYDHVQEMKFFEAEMTPIYRFYKDSNGIISFIFEVDAIGHKTQRVIYNWEDALGWIGGLLQIIMIIQ